MFLPCISVLGLSNPLPHKLEGQMIGAMWAIGMSKYVQEVKIYVRTEITN
jgi:hypothetical protein